jgi:hypothetical protein
MSEELVPLEESKVSLDDARSIIPVLAAAASVEMFHKYTAMVMASEDPEVVRKGLQTMDNLAALGAQVPKDPLFNIPRANITIDLGEDTPRSVQVTFDATPTPQMQSRRSLNLEVLDVD